GSTLATVAAWLRCASPVAALMSLLGAGDVRMRGLSSTLNVPLRFALISAGLSAVLLLWTWSRLTSRLFDRDRSSGMIVDDQTRSLRAVRRIMFLVDPNRRSRPIGPFVNPVMVKEFRCRRFGRLHWLLRLVAACGVLSLALAIL